MHFNPKTLAKQGKREAFRRQLTKDRTFRAAFPEARAKATAVYVDGDYVVAASAADDHGAGGCEIWLNLRTVIGTHEGNKLRLVEQNVSIILAQPRRLITWVQSSAFSIFDVCLQALDTSKGKQAVGEWWQETYRLLHRLIPAGATVMCSIDGNLRIRQADYPYVGTILDPPGSSGTSETFILKLA